MDILARLLFGVLFFGLFCVDTIASNHQETYPIIDCPQALQAKLSGEISVVGMHDGSEFILHKGPESAYNRDFDITVHATQTNFPWAPLKGQKFEFQGKRYQLINLGGHNLREDRQFVAQSLLQAGEEWTLLELKLSGELDDALHFLTHSQTLLQDRVFATYIERKPYLAEERSNSDSDRSVLRFPQLFPLATANMSFDTNSDIFVLYEDTEQPIHELDPEDVAKLAIMTIQLAPASKIMTSSVLPPSIEQSTLNPSLPHTMRGELQRIDLDEDIIKFANGAKLGEFTRYVNWQSDLPRTLSYFFAAQALNFAMNSQDAVDILVVSVDEETGPVFERVYGFEYIDGVSNFLNLEIDSQTGRPKEYRMFLDLRGPKAQQVLERLQRLSQQVTSVVESP